MKKIILFSILSLLLVACGSLRPNARILNHVPREAPPLYQHGWLDGCKSGLSASGNDLYRTSYHYTLKQDLIHDRDYSEGWNDAEAYCRHYGMSTLYEARLLGKNPTESPTRLEEISLASVVGNFGPGFIHQDSIADPWDTFFGVTH